MAKNFSEVFFRQVRRDQVPVLELFNPLAVIIFNDAQRLTAVRAFAHVQTLSVGYHQSKRTGALQRIIERGARAVDFLMRFLIFNIAPTLLELALAATVLSLKYGWEFAVIATVTVALYMGLTWSVTEWRVKIRRQMNEADNDASARAVDSLINFETVKSFAAERRESQAYDGAMTRYAQAAAKSQSSLALLNGTQALVMNGGLLAMALTAGWKAWTGVLQPGDVAAFQGDQRHSYVNEGTEPAVVFSVVALVPIAVR